MHPRHRSRTKFFTLSLAILTALVVTGLLAWPQLMQTSAQARTLSADQMDEVAHSLGLHWNGSEDESPIVVDFGNAPAGAPIAGMDQWFARNGEPSIEAAADVLGPKKVMVLRVYFNDYAANTRYTKAQVEGFFDELDTLWKNTSYNKINIDYEVSDLFQLPDNRSAYVDDFGDGDLSNGNKYWKVLDDAIDNAPAGLDWTGLDAIMVVMAETSNAQFHRGQATGDCNLEQGPGGSIKNVGCAIFSENPSETDRQVWGRWAHEIGHAFQEGGPAHPSNYNSEFELMDSNYPGQTGVFEKLSDQGFPGWMPSAKYRVITPTSNQGETICLLAMEYDPTSKPNLQAIKAEITDSLYYMISVRRRVLGDDLNGGFANGIPDEGVLIERVVEGGDPWVTLQAPPGLNRNSLWKEGQNYENLGDGMFIFVTKKADENGDSYCVSVRYNKAANQPDMGMYPWTSPPGDTWETTDIWFDSPVNDYGTYRYGFWNDLSGNSVPRGNGDDPAVGMVNRFYARVRNMGTATATDVKVRFEITDPPGVGIAGSNGWASLGMVDKNSFPALASIAPGAFVDVYLNWTPNFALTPEQIAEGRFAFHTCVRVKIDSVAGEIATGNQDGDREQENISYFQAVTDGGDTASYDGVIRLRNDSKTEKKTFYLSYETDVPAAWILNVNNGQRSVELMPDEVREIPVIIKPQGPAVVGSIFGVDVSASSLKLLTNDLDPKDQHPEFDPLGGARVEARVLLPARVECKATDTREGITVMGTLKTNAKTPTTNNPYRVMIQGVDSSRRFIREAATVTYVLPDGTFNGNIFSRKDKITEVICFYAGTTETASASSGYVAVAQNTQNPTATATRTPVPTWTPVPTRTPTPGPTPTPTSEFVFRPYKPVGQIVLAPLFQGDLSLHGIEVTQGIQCFDTSKGLATCPDNSLPVVTRKSTTARVYAKLSHIFLTSQSNVPVRLYIRRDGGAWTQMDTTGKALATINQSQAANSANFFFTISGNSSRIVDFYAVVDPNNAISESNENNNRYPSSGYLTMTFRPRDGLDIAGSRLDYHPSGYNSTRLAGGWAVNGGAALWFNQLLPIRDGGVNYTVNSGYRDWTTSLGSGNGQHDLIEEMNSEYVLALIFTLIFGGSADDLVDHYYGWAPNSGYSGGHADMPVYPHAGGLGVVGIGTDRPGTSTDSPGGGALIFGHELVHDYDIYHTNTGDACGSSDGNSDFPYGSSSIQEYGFNPLTQKVYKPEDTHDLMSYCPAGGSKEGWISPFTWNKMYNNFAQSAVSASAADGESIILSRSGVSRLERTNHISSLIVNATVYNPDLSKQPATLNELYKVDQGYNLVLPEGDYLIELRNGEQILISRSFVVNFESEYDKHVGETPGDPSPTEKVDVTFVMPWLDEATTVVLSYKGQVLDSRSISKSEPTVAFTSPNTMVAWKDGSQETLSWKGDDADGDSLSYALFYSYDNGMNWQLLRDVITDTKYTVEVSALAGGSDTRFRVVATDGINTAYDETDAPIVVPNKAPMPIIIEPVNGLMAEPGTLVLLQGGATDLEDGTLAEGNLTWLSDRQGALGTGYSVALDTLAAGVHVITLRATDSLGVSAESTATVTIGYGTYIPVISK